VNNLPYTIETVSVTSPDDGEPLTSSAPYTISWKINGMKQGTSIARMDLSYSKNGGVTWIPIKTIEGNFLQNTTYEYLWDTIPAVSKPKYKCNQGYSQRLVGTFLAAMPRWFVHNSIMS
jgi:hypothetical protein